VDRESQKRRIQAEARRSAIDLARQVGAELRNLREDAGLSQAQVAEFAGVSQALVSLLERAKVEITLPTLVHLAAALGASVRTRIYPDTGPPIRDHLQARMIEAFLRVLHARWRRFLEVPLRRPVRGVVDVVLLEPDERVLVATEAQSEMRRLEQQLRWSHAKADALATSDLIADLGERNRPTTVSSLLLLRSTRTTRELATTFRETLATAFPAPYEAAIEALSGRATPWPGSALIWVTVDADGTRILDRPPRGVALGR
jgi:transcriptional regulator with XRE-family HTH domain